MPRARYTSIADVACHGGGWTRDQDKDEGASQSETCAGCIVSSTTATRSSRRWSRSTSLRRAGHDGGSINGQKGRQDQHEVGGDQRHHLVRAPHEEDARYRDREQQLEHGDDEQARDIRRG